MDSSNSGQTSYAPAAEETGANRRRSTRLFVAVPVTISGKNARGETFKEETRTTVINKQGASLVTSQPLAPGSEIVIENPPLRITVRARIVQFSESASPAGVHQAGVELLEPKNVWGIQYPPADWRREPANANAGFLPHDEPNHPAPVPPSELPSITIDLPSEPRPINVVAPAADSPSVAAASGGKSRPQDNSLSAEEGAEELLERAARELARLAEETEGKVQLRLEEALNQLSEEQRTFAQKIYSASASAAESSAHLEQLIAQTEKVRRCSLEESNEARGSLQEIITQTLTTIPEEATKRISQRLETTGAAYLEEARRQAAEYMSALAKELKQDVERSLNTLAAERLAATAREIDAKYLQALGRTEEQFTKLASSRLEDFNRQMHAQAEVRGETALLQQEKECAARTTRDFDARRSETVERLNEQAEEIIRAHLENFHVQIRDSAESLRGPAISTLARELETKAEEEILGRQAVIVEQSQIQIHSVVQAGIDNFRTQIEQAAQRCRDSALASLTQECAAKATASIEACHSELARELEAKAEEKILGRQAIIVEQTQNQIHSVVQAGIDNFQAQIEQAAQHCRDSALSSLTQECAAKATASMEACHSEAAQRAQDQAQSIMRATVGDLQAQLDQAAKRFRESVLPGLSTECSAAAAELKRSQQEIVQQATEYMQGAVRTSLSVFRDQLRTAEQGYQENAEELLKLPAAQISRSAEDTLVMAREEIAGLRQGVVGEAREQLAALTRGTLASMTSEAKALMEEYRGQLRDIFDSLREKSAGAVEGCIKDGLDHGREQALRQIQKDAEDFSAVAVAQFRSHSGEAVREATDAVNKQVGSAAFVVKDWLDQATQRLDAHLSRLEARSDTALRDIEDRSQKLSGGILNDLREESEKLIGNLRIRFQNAADALIPPSLGRATPDCSPEESKQELPQHSRG